jgi:hypothetical protein
MLILLVFLPIDILGQNKEPGAETPKKQRLGSLQKSLLLPGWGQMSEKRYFEGALFLGADALCLYQILTFNHKANSYYDQYKNATNTEDAIRYRALTEKLDKKRNQYLLAVATVWTINLIDIYLVVKNRRRNPKDIKLQIAACEEKGFSITVRYSF